MLRNRKNVERLELPRGSATRNEPWLPLMSQAAVGEAEAERDRRTALAAADAMASIGEAEASHDRRQKVRFLKPRLWEPKPKPAPPLLIRRPSRKWRKKKLGPKVRLRRCRRMVPSESLSRTLRSRPKRLELDERKLD